MSSPPPPAPAGPPSNLDALLVQLREALEQHARLGEQQAADHREDRELNQQRLILEVRQLRWAQLTSALRSIALCIVALIAIVAGIALIAYLHAATTSRSVVVEAFDAPAELAPRGLTGKVVAGLLLDELTRIQASTRAAAVKRDLSGAWANDITVEVPETGVSLGELNRLVHRALGNDLHIEGQLVTANDGALQLTVRGDGVTPRRFSGPVESLDTLLARAGEYVYSQAQPYLYTDYLRATRRLDEAVDFARSVYSTVDASDRPFILNMWAFSLQSNGGSPDEGLLLLREALRLKPDYWAAYNNVINTTWYLGREQEAWRIGNDMRRAAGGRPGRAPELMFQNWDHLVWNLQGRRAGLLEDAREHGGVNTTFAAAGPIHADVDARLHDTAAAELNLHASPVVTPDVVTTALAHFVRAYLAHERGDHAAAYEAMSRYLEAAAHEPSVAYNLPGYECWGVPIAEAAGRRDEADRILRESRSYVDCRRFGADVFDARGDWLAAQREYRAAVELAPDLPAAYYSWGLALLRHGDAPGAARHFAEAHERGPTWADPVKAWGDSLQQQGKRKEALRKYEEALRLAPAWQTLQQAVQASKGQ